MNGNITGCAGDPCPMDGDIFPIGDFIDVAWVLLCTFLVVIMQLGFAMLEVGSCREAHRSTVLAKNVLDSAISCIAWWAHIDFVSPSLVCDDAGEAQRHMLIFHWAFCATAVTICSGSMSERTHMIAYLTYAMVMAGFIYPVLANAVWGRDTSGFLHSQFHNPLFTGNKYHDFAGSGVVHVTGGCSALVGNVLLGRRIMKPREESSFSKAVNLRMAVQQREAFQDMPADSEMTLTPEGGWPRRFDSEEMDADEFKPCNYLQAMGMFTLWVGWYGFNSGSTLAMDRVGSVTASFVAWNTALAAGSGGVGIYIYSYCWRKNLDVGFLCNGVVSGLVAITACCDLATAHASVLIGLFAGMVVYPLSSSLIAWMRLDDPVDAIPVHLCCGAFGVLCVAAIRPACQEIAGLGGLSREQERFCSDGHRLSTQLAAQVWGVFTLMWWTMSWSLLVWGVFAASECSRATEVAILERADTLICAMGTADIQEDVDVTWRELASKSPLAKGILKKNGWNGVSFAQGQPTDLWKIRRELLRAREEKLDSALEVGVMARLRYLACLGRPLRGVAVVRLRISPAAELSGLGAADSTGGRVADAVRKAIQALRQEHSSEDSRSALENQVRALADIVREQDAVLQALATKRIRKARTPGAASGSLIEQDNGPWNHGRVITVPRPQLRGVPELGDASEENVGETGEASSSVLWRASPRSTGDVRAMSDMRTASTNSDTVEGFTPRSELDDTPPPTLFGMPQTLRGARSAPAPNLSINDVATQLAQALQAQQQLLQTLQGTAAHSDDAQNSESSASGSCPRMLPQTQFGKRLDSWR